MNANSTVNNSISDALNMLPIPINEKSISDIIVEVEANTETDFNHARSNIYNVIENGTHALEEMLIIAKSTQEARSFEVVSTLMDSLINANKELLELNKKNIELRNLESDKIGKQTINNNLFVSASDILDMIKNRDKNE